MTRSKRQYGSGCLIKRGTVYAIRWRELVIGSDGKAARALRYETLGEVTKKEASHVLTQKLAAAYVQTTPTRSLVTFRSFVAEWDATVVPMYKHSTQGHHRQIVRKHLLPQFGDRRMCDISRQEIQRYLAALSAKGYAPTTVDYIHDVMSAILRTAVKWPQDGERGARRGPAEASLCEAEMGADDKASHRIDR